MTEKVKGMSHEYIILEDGIEVARVVCDFYPYKPGIAVSIQYDTSLRLETLSDDMLQISQLIRAHARGQVTPEWEVDFPIEKEESTTDQPF